MLVPAVVCMSLYATKQRPAVHSKPLPAPVQTVEGLQWSIESARLEDGVYHVTGWVVEPHNDSFWLHPRIVLQGGDAGQFMELRANVVQRPDINAALGGKRNMAFSGFHALVKKTHVAPGPLRVLLSVRRGGERVLIDTQTSLPEA